MKAKKAPEIKPLSLIVGPEDGTQPVVGFIQEAKKKIRLKQFKMIEPTMIQALADAASRGIDVRVILNEKRSAGDRVNDETRQLLEQRGVSVHWGPERFAVTHEKSIVVDDKQALIATFNICPTCLSKTRDYGIITANEDDVEEITACFDADWQNLPFKPLPNTSLVWSPNDTRPRVAAFIDAAKKTLDIQHPKLCDTTILDRILAAQKRGVRIRFLCGGQHGISPWDVLDSFSSWRILQHSGIRVRRQKQLKLHAKLLLADGARALISSFNLDRSAFDLRRELGIVVEERTVTGRLAQIFQRDWELAKPYRVPDPLRHGRPDPEELPDDPSFSHE